MNGTELKIALISVVNPLKKITINKDLNGGLGTADTYGNLSVFSRIISMIKRKGVKIPVSTFPFLQSIFKCKGHHSDYYEGHFPKAGSKYDLILIYGSIVDYLFENEICKKLKSDFPNAKIGFIGPFPSRFPEYFSSADFVIAGEAEAFFFNEFKSLDQLHGSVPVNSFTNYDELPTPTYDGFPIQSYGYFPALRSRPFVSMVASKGCPYSCKFYCTYGGYQGAKIRARSPAKVANDMKIANEKYGIKAVQFRDPTFGLQKGYIEEFCKELGKINVDVIWGMETRLDLLTIENITLMYNVGLRNINVGIETPSEATAKANKRKLIESSHQEKILNFCFKKGINISAFYVLGYEGETYEVALKTIEYATKMNTPLARFSVSTPYPGTGFYDRLVSEGVEISKDFEKFSQFELVYDHKTMTKDEVKKLLSKAVFSYYFRPKYILSMMYFSMKVMFDQLNRRLQFKH